MKCPLLRITTGLFPLRRRCLNCDFCDSYIMIIKRQLALMSITLPTGKFLSARAETVLQRCKPLSAFADAVFCAGKKYRKNHTNQKNHSSDNFYYLCILNFKVKGHE
jgi:hypothetical protein